MTRLKGWTVGFAVVIGLSAVVALSQTELGQEVIVTNFPKTFAVDGSVSIRGTASHAQFIRREGVVVTTSHRNELPELISAGVIDADGFTSVTVSLQGEVKASATADGTVGVMLVPDEEPVLRALRDARRVEFPIEATCQLTKGASPYFDSGSITQPLGFSRYKVLLYNTAPHAVEANVYIDLKN